MESELRTESPAAANPRLSPKAVSYVPNSFLCPKINLEFFCLWKDTNEFSVLKMMVENVNVVLSVRDTKGVNTMKSRERFIFS